MGSLRRGAPPYGSAWLEFTHAHRKDTIVVLAGLLDVTADELLGLEASSRPQAPKDRRLVRRLQAFDSLPKRDTDAAPSTPSSPPAVAMAAPHNE